MNKDNLLFATIGLLFGFIAGYLLHEVMAARQPARRLAGGAAAVAGAAPGAPLAPGAQVGPEAAPPGAGDGSQNPEAGNSGGASAAGPMGAAGPAGTGDLSGAAQGAAGAPSAQGAAAMQAIQRLREHVAANPKDADAVVELANLNYDIRNWSRARDLYQQYLGLRPPTPDVLTDLGICYRSLKDFQRALDLFHQAEKLSPGHWQARYNEVVVLAFDLNRFDAAAPVLAVLEKMQPSNSDVGQLAAEVNRRRGAR